MKLYMAGPLFTTAELDFNRRLRDALVALGHEVFLPQEKEERNMTTRAIFEHDVAGIHWADAVVGCMDGADPDSGTCWEVGYAYGRGVVPGYSKRIVLYRTDFRAEKNHGPYNLMLTQSADDVIDGAFIDVLFLAAKIDAALRGVR